MKQIASKTFVSQLISETSYHVSELGKHKSTMYLYFDENNCRGLIEWDIPPLQTVVEIGLSFEDDCKNLQDYDGVFSLPKEAIELLEENGFNADYAK